MLSKRRGAFTGLSVKVGIAFSKLGLSPNQWTAVSIAPVVIAAYFLAVQNFLAAAAFFAISAFLDLVDGSVARVTGRVTRLGAYLDTIVDRYVEFFIVIGLFFAGLPPFYLESSAWLVLFLFGSMLTTYAKAAAKEKDLTEEEMKGGLIERPERLILLFIGILLGVFSRLYLTYVVVLLAVLTNISALQRIVSASRLTRRR